MSAGKLNGQMASRNSSEKAVNKILAGKFGAAVGLTSWPAAFALAALCPLTGWWVLGPLAERERRLSIRGPGSPR